MNVALATRLTHPPAHPEPDSPSCAVIRAVPPPRCHGPSAQGPPVGATTAGTALLWMPTHGRLAERSNRAHHIAQRVWQPGQTDGGLAYNPNLPGRHYSGGRRRRQRAARGSLGAHLQLNAARPAPTLAHPDWRPRTRGGLDPLDQRPASEADRLSKARH